MTTIASFLLPAGCSVDKGMALWFGPQRPLRWEPSADQAFHGPAGSLAGTTQNWIATANSQRKTTLPTSIPSRSIGDLTQVHCVLFSIWPALCRGRSLLRDTEGKLYRPGGQLFGDNTQLRWEGLIPEPKPMGRRKGPSQWQGCAVLLVAGCRGSLTHILKVVQSATDMK